MSEIKRWDFDVAIDAMDEFDDGEYVLHSDHVAEVARLRAEVEKYRKDAERYRWLIQSLFSQWFAVGDAEIGMRVYGQCPSKEVVERAIDAAMGASA